MTEIATRTSWQNYPIDNPLRVEISMHFTQEQFKKLTQGLLPEQMEDKWFIFYEKGWLYFHRSWTGFGLYKAQLLRENEGYSIKEFWVERNQEKYTNTDEEEDIQNVYFLIYKGLLGVDVGQLPTDKIINSEGDALKGWSHFGNMLFTNKGLDNS